MCGQCLIGVVVPAYNEAGNVGEVIETIPAFVDRTYVVDDHSSDRTWEEITAVAETLNRSRRSSDGGVTVTTELTDVVEDSGRGAVVPIRHDQNTGVGGAITTGYRRAREDGMDIAVVMAGDGQMDPDILPRILDPVVSGRVRYSKGNRLGNNELVRGMPNWRLFGNLLLTCLTRIASGYWRMTDPQNGYTAIDLSVFDEIQLDDLHRDYGFCNDLLVRLNTVDAPIADVPMRARYGDEQSHIRYSRFMPKLSLLLARNFLWRLRTSYLERRDPLPIVLLLGLLCFPVGFVQTLRAAVPGAGSGGRRDRSMFSAGAALTLLSLAVDRHRNTGLVEKETPDDTDEHVS